MVTNLISNRQSVMQIIRAASSDIISILSGSIFSFALSLMLLHTTHSAISFGLESVVYPVVGLLLVVPIGNFVDTHAHKPLIVTSKVLTLLALVVYSLVIFRLPDRLLASIIIIAIFGVNDKLSGTGYTASVHELVNDAHIKPLAAIEQSASSAVQLVSPLLAALLYAMVGFRGILLIEMGAETLVILITLSMHFHVQPRVAETTTTKPSQLAAFRVGLRYIWQNATLQFIVELGIALNLLFSSVNIGLSYVMIQVLKLGNVRLGWVSSAVALGMLGGNLLLMKLPTFKHLVRDVLCLCGGFGVVFLAMGALLLPALSANVVTIGLMCCGMADGLLLAWINTPMGIYMQTTVPTQLLGRVSVTLVTLNSLAMPLGTVIYSWLFQNFSGSVLFLVTGALTLGLVALFWRRRHDDQPPLAATPVASASQAIPK